MLSPLKENFLGVNMLEMKNYGVNLLNDWNTI